ncbi:hypothetical protein BGW39_006945 [Mortierella sp. 14UC]|nr:hypothetical protein BGW39_006945 [Mortierella sp. 14UC]
MSELRMYFGIAVGCIALLGICGGIIYRKYRQDVKVKLAVEQEIQDRLQHVVDLNLPPFYIDHELDPVCIYEHELPPDVLPPVQPIFVHSASDDSMLIPPEDDPLVAHSTATAPSIASTTNDHLAMLFSPAIAVNNVETGREGSTLNAAQTQDGYFAPVNTPTPPLQAAFFSPVMRCPTTPSSVLSSSIPTVARSINQEMIVLARVRAPPSYDVPNGDYFGHVRIRAHTFSHSSSSSPTQAFLQQLQQQHFHYQQERADEETLPETPRYSLEFPADVPHEHHLKQHQRSRTHYDNSSGSNSMTRPRLIRWQEAIPSSPLLMFEQTTTTSSSRRGARPVLRARASTLGESSKALMQRMHSLLRHSTSARSRDSTLASSPRLAAASIEGGGSSTSSGGAGVPMVGLGLGLEYGGHIASEQVIPVQDQDQAYEQIVVVVDEPEEEENAAGTASAAGALAAVPTALPSGPISLHSSPSTESLALTVSPENDEYENAPEQAHSADKEEEDEAGEDESASKAQHQHAPQPAPSVEPMATMSMPLAVS